jgi:hypothetical protein
LSRPLPALTLTQPWAWAISHGSKRIENREWDAPWLVGRYLAIHAGKTYDAEAAADLASRFVELGPISMPPAKDLITLGAIVAVARVARFIHGVQGSLGYEVPPGDPLVESPWFAGPIGWVLEDVTAIDPVPCRGYQRIWTVPGALADEVRRRWAAARGRTP